MTPAFDDITNEAETELAFESLATRTEGNEPVIRVTSIEDDIVDPFNDTAKGSEIFGEATVKATVDQGWAAFKPAGPPSRPPPPKRPPRPSRPAPTYQDSLNSQLCNQ